MSGGVDSTVAAALLREEGHQVVGLTMQIWDGFVDLPVSARPSCFGPDEPRELEAVRSLAGRLGIPHHTIPLAAEYRELVLDYFRREYRAGRTPNPCVRCNREMKFGLLLSAARRAGAEFDLFATGHYARVERDPATGRYLLLRAIDREKDQSYFLARLTQEQLTSAIFPLGGWEKSRVREAARRLGLDQLADQPESRDFVGGDYSPLFAGTAPPPGPILDREGKVLGRHRGIVHYTVGQRRGLGLSGGGPYYVLALDAGRNAVIVGEREELFSPGLLAGEVNWIALPGLEGPLEAEVRIRRSSPAVPALLSPVSGGPPDAVRVDFATPQSAVAPGQAAVFYRGETVLGGGWILRALGQEERGSITVQ